QLDVAARDAGDPYRHRQEGRMGSPVTAHSIAIVGAVSRGIVLLEWIAANAPELLRGRLTVHLVDPFPPGPGRVWRFAQSPLLRMNSMPEDVTMFTDDSVKMAGPVLPGPSLLEWARQVRDGVLDAEVPPDVVAELTALDSFDFP